MSRVERIIDEYLNGASPPEGELTDAEWARWLLSLGQVEQEASDADEVSAQKFNVMKG